MGGTLKDCDNHWQSHCEHASSHHVILNEGIFFDQMVKRNICVNSFHRQTLDKVPDSIKVEGISPDDGIVECISVPNSRIIGVQWHPSYAKDYFISQHVLELFSKI